MQLAFKTDQHASTKLNTVLRADIPNTPVHVSISQSTFDTDPQHRPVLLQVYATPPTESELYAEQGDAPVVLNRGAFSSVADARTAAEIAADGIQSTGALADELSKLVSQLVPQLRQQPFPSRAGFGSPASSTAPSGSFGFH